MPAVPVLRIQSVEFSSRKCSKRILRENRRVPALVDQSFDLRIAVFSVWYDWFLPHSVIGFHAWRMIHAMRVGGNWA